MADDSRNQPYLLSNLSKQLSSIFSNNGFAAGIVFGACIFPVGFVFDVLKARAWRQSKPLDLLHDYRPGYKLRRLPICIASVRNSRAPIEESQLKLTLLKQSRIPWRWIRRVGGRSQVGTSLIVPGRRLSPLGSMLLRDAQEAWPRDPVRSTKGVTQGRKKRTCVDMRRVVACLRDPDACLDTADCTLTKEVPWEECMGAYVYKDTLRGPVRILQPPEGPWARKSLPTESYKAGQ